MAAHRVRDLGVDAAPARLHLQQLAALGVGYRTVARQTGISSATVYKVRGGLVTRLRASTAARLLTARPCLAHGALVAATKTWRSLDSLRREGFTHREMAYHLGNRSQQLQLQPRQVRVASALRVAQLYARITT